MIYGIFLGPLVTPTLVQSEVTTTTATISWRVTEVDHNPENYTVAYSGLDLQPETKDIEWILSDPANTPTPTYMYSVLLDNLEEANMYNYTVQATNCIGITNTNTLQFTTLSDSELKQRVVFLNSGMNIACYFRQNIQR